MAKEGLGLEHTELRLGLPGNNNSERSVGGSKKKRVFAEVMMSASIDTESGYSVVSSEDITGGKTENDSLPVVNRQVVGWPPVCSYRKKNEISKATGFVKVSMDGVPYLRKIDLGSSNGYNHLAIVLENLFGCLDLEVALKGGEKNKYVIIYEDKDRDWMLIGDVPWQMFKESCKKLRIVKRSDATGFRQQGDSSKSLDNLYS